MDAPDQKPPFAWQPLTPRGVAAFAGAPLGRLLTVQVVVALLAAGAVVWFLHTAWFPVVTQAIERLPTQGELRDGRLDWRGDSPETLAEGRFLALVVDLRHEGQARSPAHVQIEFGQSDFQIFSLFGFLPWAYPRGCTVACNRPALEPWWGAWAPPLLAVAAGGVMVGLLLLWALLATAYSGAAWVLGFFANREATLRGSWRLAGAALMPGALFLSGAGVLYGLGTLDLVQLLAAGVLHLLIGWIYLLLSPWWLPRHPQAAEGKGNPFQFTSGH